MEEKSVSLQKTPWTRKVSEGWRPIEVRNGGRFRTTEVPGRGREEVLENGSGRRLGGEE